ncbi:MAG TPA: DUF2357 domain-containing protein [Ktedonobacteraceae bacterium]|jgi:predicted component of viral defense system (DUF524 family)
MATLVSGANAWLTINQKPLRFEPRNENEQLIITEYSRNMIRITSKAPEITALLIDDQELETDRYGMWIWNPKHYAGLYRFVVQLPGSPPQTALVRVFPHKFSQPLYEKMKKDLSETALDLLFRLDSPAMEKAEYVARVQETSPLHDYHQIRAIIEKLRDIMSHLHREPYSTLHEQSTQQDWQEISHFSDRVTPLPGESIILPQALAERHRIRALPQRWTMQQSRPTYDIYENRLLKHFLQRQLTAKLEIIQEHAKREKKQREAIYARYHNDEDGETISKLNQAIAACQEMKQRCIQWSSEPFLKTVQSVALLGKATQVLLKHPTYSRFYHLYLQFQKRLKTTHNTDRYVTELAMRKVSELYEMWSVFLITRMAIEELLAADYQMVSNTTFYQIEKNAFQFDVRKNVASIVLKKENRRVEIKYEPIYPNQSTVTLRSALVATTIGSYPLTPDMAIEVYQDDQPQDVLIFDAKYRWDRASNGSYYPKQEDIEKMYRYRDNIQYKRYQQGQTRRPYTIDEIVRCAYILYPGNKIHSESKNGSIGSLPLIPNMSSQRLDEVREQLKDLLYYAYLID